MKLITIAFLVFCSLSLSAQTDKRLKGLEKELNEVLKVTKAAGFSVAIVEKNKIIYAKGFGYRDYENKIEADENTLYAIGSCSKSFTSGLLGQLRAEDKLSFDDSPMDYIPELKFYNDELANSVIIKDLMSHRTGLPRHDNSWYLFPTFDKDSLVRRIKYQEPFTGVRKQWYYNNFMFLLQGVIAEKLSGKSWEENIKEKFFNPLGMSRSNVSIEELKDSENAAFGYQLKDDSIIKRMDYYNIAAMSPAGSINSSVKEMSNWAIIWINNGKFNGEEILPPNYVKEAISSQAIIGGGMPTTEYPDMFFQNYGYGWMLSSYKSHYRVEHGGNIDGFSANTAFYPTDSIGVIVLANQNGSAVPSIVRNTIADRLLGTEKTDWIKWFLDGKAKQKEAQKNVEENKKAEPIVAGKSAHMAEEFQGSYSHPGYGSFKISVERDSLFASFKLVKAWLKHKYYDVYEPFMLDDGKVDTTASWNLMFNFYTNDSGEISGVKAKIEPALENPIEFKRTPKLIEVSKEILINYVGEYELPGALAKVYIKDEKTLFVEVPGQPEYELLPIDKNKFAFKSVEGFKLEFHESAEKKIEAVSFIQPNGTFKAKKK